MTDGKLIDVSRPSYLAEFTPEKVDNSDIAQYAKPPRIKVVQALSGPPVKPPFKESDIIVVPQMVKIGDSEQPFTFVPIAFFSSWVCLNPIQMRGSLKTIREFSLDPNSNVARKAQKFIKEKCPENPEYFLKYCSNLNFMCILEDTLDELRDMPMHLFFSRGSYATGQALITLIQRRPAAPRYAMRFRAATGILTSKQYQYTGLVIENDPKPWVEEANFPKYEKFANELKSLIDSRQLDLDTDDLSSEDTSEFN